MRHLVWVELDSFYTSVYSEPAPLTVARERKILDANAAARQRGVVPGLTVRQAKALIDGLVVRPWQADRYAARRNEWLNACTEFTGIIEPEDQHAASLDLTGHPDPLDVTERIVRALSRLRMGRVRYGVASSKWIARLAAEREDVGWVVDDPAGFLAPLPVLDLLPIIPEHRERLHFLGYRQVGDLVTIPLATLQSQFGEEGLRIRQAALGALFEPVHARYPEGSLVENVIFESPVESTEIRDAAVRNLAKCLGDRLVDGAWQTSDLALTVEDGEGERHVSERRFTKPLRDAVTALAALNLLIEGLTCNEALASLHVKLSNLEPVKRRQAALNGFVPQGERRPKADAAVHYVRTVYGDRAVQRGSEIELPRRVQVLREWKNATGWR